MDPPPKNHTKTCSIFGTSTPIILDGHFNTQQFICSPKETSPALTSCISWSGWWARATPLKNMSSSIGMIRHPIYAKISKTATKPPTSYGQEWSFFLAVGFVWKWHWPRCQKIRSLLSPLKHMWPLGIRKSCDNEPHGKSITNPQWTFQLPSPCLARGKVQISSGSTHSQQPPRSLAACHCGLLGDHG